ncbi:hypothetical protein EAO71_25740 [Streptomyces sp. ms191]|uniref:Pr6Pr family membrane protein n=1 Tax=Streptomyces sp. ms191 TaxID=1827978 RepID=UPI0011CD3ACD|nr:Pr6Pr family membrane protein [Streptomyces sp. ms191]TXS22183.1 hypothetical protein EAO71_25740 [Streptomyces sp. ms191]
MLAGAAGIIGDAVQSFQGAGPAEFWIYFTIQSNLLLVAYFALLLVRAPGRSGSGQDWLPVVKGAVTLYILITGLVFNLLLANPASPFYVMISETHYNWHSVMLHIVTPTAALLDWLVFGPKGSLAWRHALQWLGFPLLYLAFALVRGVMVTTGTRYPYPFVDVAQYGYGAVAINCVALALAFYLLGVVLVAVDRRFTGRRHLAPVAPTAETEPTAHSGRQY